MKMSDRNNREVGTKYEDIAVKYLTEKGYEILDRNYHHHRMGEIDIIAKDGDTIVAVEVKYRKTKNFGSPLEAVGYKKQRSICHAFLAWLMEHGLGQDTPCRFDVIGLWGEGTVTIKHIENAFDYIGD